jgi:glycosyltransferase involved in cell wall biosynthesis
MNMAGHYYEYARVLFEEAQQRGDNFFAIGHINAAMNDMNELPVSPVFRHTFGHTYIKYPILRLADPLAGNYFFYKDLCKAVNHRITENSILFMTTVTHQHLLAWALWAVHRSLAKNSRVVLLFRRNLFDMTAQQWNPETFWMRIGFKLLEKTGGRNLFQIATDTHRLAKEYGSLTRLPIHIFPIPHTLFKLNSDRKGDKEPFLKDPNKIKLVSLGDARMEKGFPELVDAVVSLKNELEAGYFEVVLQCNINGMDIKAINARKKLEKMQLSGVTLITDSLSSEDYYGLLKKSDCLLIPYRKNEYYSRSSGIFAEAVAAGKPVITTADTWMGSQIQEGKGSGILIRSSNTVDLINAIKTMVSDYTRYKNMAERSRESWLDFHSPHSLYNMLIS